MSSSSSTARTSRSRRICRASSPIPPSARRSTSSSSARARRRPGKSRSAASRTATRRCRRRPRRKDEPAEKPVTQKALGLDLATLSKDLRARYKIKDSVKGVIITSVDGTSDAAEKRLSAGEVIVEVAQEAVSNAADVKKRVDQLKKDGKKSVLLLVANADGELRFVALSVQ